MFTYLCQHGATPQMSRSLQLNHHFTWLSHASPKHTSGSVAPEHMWVLTLPTTTKEVIFRALSTKSIRMTFPGRKTKPALAPSLTFLLLLFLSVIQATSINIRNGLLVSFESVTEEENLLEDANIAPFLNISEYRLYMCAVRMYLNECNLWTGHDRKPRRSCKRIRF